jgi:NADH:quinone reductase (non-electrogenic)
MSATEAHRVVIVGGGFGGMYAALGLKDAPVEVTLIDKRNFHLFQPLTYQVATGGLSPGEIAYPLRGIFKRQQNVRIMLAEVAGIDVRKRELQLSEVDDVPAPATIGYDSLIVAGGASYSYFGHDSWSKVAHEVKSLESALTVRGRLLRAFEAAESEDDETRRQAWLTFVIVGAGPTGVEIAGQIGELARDTLKRDFRTSDPRSARILLVEAADRVLTSFPASLSRRAAAALNSLGVTPMLGATVVDIDGTQVTVNDKAGNTTQIPTRTVVWAAGVTASPLAAMLGQLTGAELDAAGRVTVESDLTLPHHPEIFAIGDMVRIRQLDGTIRQLPGVAPAAMQEGRHAAKVIKARLSGGSAKPFHYVDKGNLATIGRGAAVADIKHLHLSGLPAWLIWLVVHLWYLVGFQNRILVFIRWSFSFWTHGRGARLITNQTAPAD